MKAGVHVPRIGGTATAAQTAVLVTYCCITNYHKCSGLKQHPFISPQFYCMRFGMAWLCSVLWLPKADIKVSVSGLSSYLEALGKNLLPNHTCCWQNSIPCGCTTRSLFPCWLWARDHSQQLKATYIPWHVVSSTLKPTIVHQILLVLRITDLLCLWPLDPDLKG